jgi:acyl-coenzyme A thioesterase PaaI-like protein
VVLDEATIRGIFGESIPFLRKVRVVVEKAEPGSVRLVLPYEKDNENYWGTGHAGAIFTFGETCGGVLVAASFPVADLVLLAKGATIHYVKKVDSDIVSELGISQAEVDDIMGRLQKEESLVYPISMELNNRGGETVARMTIDYYFRIRRP